MQHTREQIMHAMFERFELELTLKQAMSVSTPGQDALENVEIVLQDSKVIAQLNAIGPSSLRDELKEYGAWNDDELTDDESNRERIVWIAGCNIREEME